MTRELPMVLRHNLSLGPDAPRPRWATLYRVGGWSAWTVLALIPIQGAIYMLWPPPLSVTDWFALFARNPLVGLLNFDLLFVVTNVLMIPIYLALFASLRREDESLTAIALTLSLVGLTVFFPTNGAFEMLSLSQLYANAATEVQRVTALAAGQTMLATWQGMAFNVYYMLSAAALLIFSVVMLRSTVFTRVAAYAGVVAGLMMLVPASAGQVGLVLSFLSLVPTIVWLVSIARTFGRLEGDRTLLG